MTKDFTLSKQIGIIFVKVNLVKSKNVNTFLMATIVSLVLSLALYTVANWIKKAHAQSIEALPWTAY